MQNNFLFFVSFHFQYRIIRTDIHKSHLRGCELNATSEVVQVQVQQRNYTRTTTTPPEAFLTLLFVLRFHGSFVFCFGISNSAFRMSHLHIFLQSLGNKFEFGNLKKLYNKNTNISAYQICGEEI